MPSLRSGASGDNDVRIKVSTTADNSGTDQAKAGLKGVGDQAHDTGDRFTSMSTAAKVAVAAIGASVLAVGKTFVQSAADLQQTSKSFEVLTGNVEIANGLFAQLATYANTTPFEFPDIAKAGQTLLGFGISSDQVFDKIKVLGDLAAATGANFSSLAVVFGQVNATGKLMGGDALQLVNNSIPIYNMLAKQMGVETGKVKEQIEKGAVSVDIFNAALANATKEGGFAFKGVDTLANSFNGRMSTLNDAMLDFGRNLLGVRVDNKLGLVIEEGGLFDTFSDMLPVISSNLNNLVPSFTAVIEMVMGFASSLGEVFMQMQEYLSPKIEELWGTIQENLIPVLGRLWHEVLEPLAEVFGGLFVGALGITIETLTILVTMLTDFVNWALDNGEFMAPIIGALVAFKAAMILNATFAAATALFTTFTAVTIPSAAAAFTGFAALVASPIVWPALVIGAAIASIWAVVDAYKGAMAAMDQADAAAAGLKKTEDTIRQGARDRRARGEITEEQYQRMMSIANRASGGPVSSGQAYAVGDNPDGSWNPTTELFIPGQSGTIVSNKQIKQALGSSQGSEAGGGTRINMTIDKLVLASDSAVREFFDQNNRDTQIASMGGAIAGGDA